MLKRRIPIGAWIALLALACAGIIGCGEEASPPAGGPPAQGPAHGGPDVSASPSVAEAVAALPHTLHPGDDGWDEVDLVKVNRWIELNLVGKRVSLAYTLKGPVSLDAEPGETMDVRFRGRFMPASCEDLSLFGRTIEFSALQQFLFVRFEEKVDLRQVSEAGARLLGKRKAGDLISVEGVLQHLDIHREGSPEDELGHEYDLRFEPDSVRFHPKRLAAGAGWRFSYPAVWRRVPDTRLRSQEEALRRATGKHVEPYAAAFEASIASGDLAYPYVLVQVRAGDISLLERELASGSVDVSRKLAASAFGIDPAAARVSLGAFDRAARRSAVTGRVEVGGERVHLAGSVILGHGQVAMIAGYALAADRERVEAFVEEASGAFAFTDRK